MSLEEIEAAALDSSISDDLFFEMLLGYFANMDEQDRKSQTVNVVDSPEFLQKEQDSERVRILLENTRPTVFIMLRQLLLEQHRHCCGPDAHK